jgi:DHA1 family multidrug resistance protein-like MFS transporter
MSDTKETVNKNADKTVDNGVTGAPPDHPSHRYWQRNAHAIAWGNLLTNLGWSGAFAFLPLIVREMNPGDQLELWTGLMAGAYTTVSFLFTPVWGVFADHYGRKSMVLRAGLGMGIGFMFVTMMGNPLLFLLFLALTGLANGYVPAGQALVATTTPHNKVGGALAYTQSFAWVGNMLGPIIAALLMTVLPLYRHLFGLASFTSFAAGLLALIIIRELHVRPSHPLRLEMRADLRRLWAVPQLKLLYFMGTVFAFTVFGANAIVTLFTLRLLEVMPAYLGLGEAAWVAVIAAGFTLAGVAALPFWGRLLNQHDAGKVLRIQLTGSLITSLLMPLVQDPLQLAIARSLFAVFITGLQPTLIRMVREKAPAGMDGRTLSYGTALQQVGNAVGPILGGLMAPWLGLRSYFIFCTALIGLALVLWLRREKGEGKG